MILISTQAGSGVMCMESTTNNPALSSLLRGMTIVETLVVIGAGLILFFLPALAKTLWPWEITPFNTRFIGAIYLAALTLIIPLAHNTRWSPARVILPMIFVFTAWMFVVSLLYLPRFDFAKPGTWAWFILYGILPLNAGYHLWKYRELNPANAGQPPSALRGLLLAVSILSLLYALALTLLPAQATVFWPWPIDSFHAQMYAGMFAAGGVGSLIAARSASLHELTLLGLGFSVFGVLAIAGLFIVDNTVHKVAWPVATTWAFWVGLFAAGLFAGLMILLTSRRPAQAAAAQPV
jgi:hypothetical protein